MDVDSTLEMIIYAIYDGDVTSARERMRDVDEWIMNGGYVPANYPHVVERMESFELETAELITALHSNPWEV